MKKIFFRKYVFCLTICFLAAIINIEAKTVLDYDGDGKTDLAVVRFDQSTPNFVWYILQSRDGFRANVWGLQSDVPRFDCDFDGDGKTDLTILRSMSQQGDPNRYWYILESRNNTLKVIKWGLVSDRPVPQDYDGDGRTDLAVYRAGWWYILRSSDNQPYAEQFGNSEAPLTGGDYDGDGKADLAVVQGTPPQSPGGALPMTLFIRRSLDGTWASYNLGDARFTGVLTGDYDGDGKADVAIWQGNLWLWIRSSDNKLEGVRFGQPPNDVPVPGDYDGDGKTDPAVFRRSFPQSYFYLLQSRDGFRAVQWGNNQDGTDGSIGMGGTRYIPAAGF